MGDPTLRAATASEPLTLEQEYEMQASWRDDADKLTFIACLPPQHPASGPAVELGLSIRGKVDDAPDRMIGDVNLFLSVVDDDDDHEDGESSQRQTNERLSGELELMIARQEYRGKGFGRAIVLAMMQYIDRFEEQICHPYLAGQANSTEPDPILTSLPDSAPKAELTSSLTVLIVKIDKDNDPSIKLFESLGFAKSAAAPNYFGEWDLRLNWDAATRQQFRAALAEEYRIEGNGVLSYELQTEGNA